MPRTSLVQKHRRTWLENDAAGVTNNSLVEAHQTRDVQSVQVSVSSAPRRNGRYGMELGAYLYVSHRRTILMKDILA